MKACTTLLLLAALAGCGDDSSATSAGGGGASSSAPSTGASPTSSSGGGSTTSGEGGATPTTTGDTSSVSAGAGGDGGDGGAAPVADVHVEARGVPVDGGVTRFSWSNGTVRTRIDGAELSMQLNTPAGTWFTVEVDGQAVRNFEAGGGLATYEIATGLTPGEHDVSLVRRVEGTFGATDFVALVPGAGTTIVPTPAKTRRLEIIGDSLSAGYGIEGADPCDFSGETESSYATYGAIAARALGAEVHIVAQSGKGVIQNYGGNLDGMMPELWRRALTNEAAPSWAMSSWQPDAVVVNLGTNDFSAPFSEDAFVDGYAAFLAEIRAAYPSSPIVCVTWSIWGQAREQLVVDAVAASGDPSISTTRFLWDGSEGIGCDGHTNAVTNARLGEEMRATLAALLGW